MLSIIYIHLVYNEIQTTGDTEEQEGQIRLCQEKDGEGRVWRRKGTAHDLKQTTSSVISGELRRGLLWLSVELGHWSLLMM